MACPWCEERPELDRQIQQSIDEGRLRDYIFDVIDGSKEALAAALHLVDVAVTRGTLMEIAVGQLTKAAHEGGFDMDSVVEAVEAA